MWPKWNYCSFFFAVWVKPSPSRSCWDLPPSRPSPSRFASLQLSGLMALKAQQPLHSTTWLTHSLLSDGWVTCFCPLIRFHVLCKAANLSLLSSTLLYFFSWKILIEHFVCVVWIPLNTCFSTAKIRVTNIDTFALLLSLWTLKQAIGACLGKGWVD